MALTPRQAIAMVESVIKEKRMIFDAVARMLGGGPKTETEQDGDEISQIDMPRDAASIARRIAEVRRLGTTDRI